MEYNIYCDESCHLFYDNSDFLILGVIQCPKIMRRQISEGVREIKKRHGLNRNFEIKWTKIGSKKIDFYQELLDFFFIQKNLEFKCLILKNKKSLIKYLKKDYNDFYFNDAYNLWYYSAYYTLLNLCIDPTDNYNIFIDIKDTKGGERIQTLHNVLCSNIYDYKKTVIKKIQLIRSEESEILQLTDLLIGALGYYNRHKEEIDSGANYHEFNLGKISIIEKIKKLTGLTLTDGSNQNNFKIICIDFEESLKDNEVRRS